MTARIDASINKETIKFICDQIGVSTAFLAKKTSLAEDKVGSWLDSSNDTYPTLNQAKTLAKALKVPFAGLYMQKEKIPIKQLPSLRNLRTVQYASTDDSVLNLAIYELIRYHDFLISAESDLEISTSFLALPTIPEKKSVVDYADIIRSYFELDLNEQFLFQSARKFYLYVRKQIESKGVFVQCFTGVDVIVARGISIFKEHSPIIGINDNDRYPAKTFSIIHELVHILKKQSTLCNEISTSFSSQDEEVFCNAVAAEVLVPKASLSIILNNKNIINVSMDVIESIAKKYNVSKDVIARRLYDMSQISKDEYEFYLNEIRQNFESERRAEKIARQEGRASKITKIPSREAADKMSPGVCKALFIGYNDGYFSKQEMSGILGIKEKHIPKFLMEVAKWR